MTGENPSTSYLTDLFSDSRPDPVSADNLEQYTFHLHDFLLRCARTPMDLYVVTDILLSEQYESLHREITGQSMSNILQQIVESNSDLHVILWSQHSEATQVISPSLKKLVRARHKKEGRRGNIRISCSGTRDRLDQMPYFLIATSHDRSQWLVRIERPNQYSGSILDLQMRNLTFDSQTYRQQNLTLYRLGCRLKTRFDEMLKDQ